MARTSESPISFVLRDPSSKAPTPIVGMIHFNNERLKVATGFKIVPNHWSETKHRVKNVVDAIHKDQVNTFLDNLSTEVGNIIADLKGKRQLNKETLRERIKNYLDPVVKGDKPDTLLKFLNTYIDSCPTRIVRGTAAKAGQFISANTVRRYKTSLNGLRAFADIHSRPLTFNNIDRVFYKEYIEWLTAKNYATNNISKYIENIKTFMNIAVEEGLTDNISFLKFATPREDAESIYLTETELSRIYSLDLSKSTRLERVRDLFIFASWTGLRFSDFSTIQPEHFKSDKKGRPYIDLRQRKTGGRVIIPFVHEAVSEILLKYDHRLPKGISNQKTNDFLKEICQLADIRTKELKHITKGGRVMVKTVNGWDSVSDGVEKWMLVSTHTARRSFASNMWRRGYPSELLMKVTGHKKLAMFLKYVKATEHETLEVMYKYLEEKKY